MKIHMDYLENKLELLQPQLKNWDQEKSKLNRQLQTEKEKLQLVKANKDNVITDLKRKLSETTDQLKQTIKSKNMMERQFSQDLKNLQNVHRVNSQAENSFHS